MKGYAIVGVGACGHGGFPSYLFDGSTLHLQPEQLEASAFQPDFVFWCRSPLHRTPPSRMIRSIKIAQPSLT